MKNKKKKIKAELFDKMQFCFKKYYDRMIHSYFIYEGTVYIDKIKSILLSFYKQVDIFHSSYYNGLIKSYWKVRYDYSIDDILTIKESNNIYDDSIKYLTSTKINSSDKVQIKLNVFIDTNKNLFSLCFLVNHMVIDGGDLKYLISSFIQAYNQDKEVILKNKSRAFENIYKDMNEEKRKVALNLYKNKSSSTTKYKFNFTEKSKEDKPNIAILNFTSDESRKIIDYSKNNNYSITDIFLAAYGYTSLSFLKSKKDFKYPFIIQSMVDLRRYIKNKDDLALANFTGKMDLSFNPKVKNIKEILKEINNCSKKQKEDALIGLSSLPLLKLDYILFINRLGNLMLSSFFDFSNFALSNIGILDKDRLQIKNASILQAHISGACRKKGKVMLSITSLNNTFTLSIPFIGNDSDKELIILFLNKIKENILMLIKE